MEVQVYIFLFHSHFTTIGFIDFGDLVYTQAVCEPAICLAYLSIYFSENPIEAILPALRSYHNHFPLSNEELEVYTLSFRIFFLHNS